MGVFFFFFFFFFFGGGRGGGGGGEGVFFLFCLGDFLVCFFLS